MKKFHIRIVGGWCGNRMVMIRDFLNEYLLDRGYEFKMDQQSIWENNAPPFFTDLVLQLFPAFSADELKVPILSIRPFLRDLKDPETLENIIKMMDSYYPNIVTATLATEKLVV